MKLFCANSLIFDFKKNIGKVDYIMSSPPFYQGYRELTIDEKIKGMNGLFGETPEEHVSVLLEFFRKLTKELKIHTALIQFDYGLFLKISKGIKESKIDYPSKVEKVKDSIWSALNEQDIYALLSRYFPNPKGKILLDPYCGTGRILHAAEKIGMNTIGIDISSSQLEIASKCLIPN